MLRLYIVLSLCFSITLGIYQADAQNIAVVYSSKTKYPDIMLEGIPALAEDSKSYFYSLIIDGGKSVYRRDSCLLKKPVSYSTVFERLYIYKDYSQDIWLRILGSYKDEYGYERKISELTKNNDFHWTKTGVEKQILGYTCIEVVDRDRRACYTTKIPVPDGPHDGIYGLPGLVLEHEDQSGHDIAIDIIYNHDEKIEIPQVHTTSNESEIKTSLLGKLDLPEDKAIILDENTPTQVWFKFKHK